jgi:hypothetical protein
MMTPICFPSDLSVRRDLQHFADAVLWNTRAKPDHHDYPIVGQWVTER